MEAIVGWPDRDDLPDYRNGFHDGRMDALLPRAGAKAPADASEAYRAGYTEGRGSVRPPDEQAA